MTSLTTAWASFHNSPLFGLLATLLAYEIALELQRRLHGSVLANPVLVAAALIVLVMAATDISYDAYMSGAGLVFILLGPATVALAVPLYAQIGRLKRMWLPIGVALLVGSTVAIASAVAIARVFGASSETMLSLAPKSATLPIAMSVAEQIGGVPALAAMAVAATGIGGAIMARPLLNLLRIEDPAVRGFSVGIAAHAAGTARALQVGTVNGAFAALALALNGVATALLMPVLIRALRPLL